MPVYAVERSLPGITLEQLASAQNAAITTSKRFTAEGKDVRYIRTMYIPSDEGCTCLFEAPDAERVKAVNDAAGIPYTAVKEAMDLTP